MLKPDAETLALLANWGAAQVSVSEIAQYFGQSTSQIKKAMKRYPELKTCYQQAKLTSLVNLRQAQFNLAKTNATMAIFLGKHYLHQHDKAENHHLEANVIKRIEHIIIDHQQNAL